jgi:hypothetical protein
MGIVLMLDFTQWDGLSYPVACTVEEAEMSGSKPFCRSRNIYGWCD